MKSLTIKIPLTIAQTLDDRGQLNPPYLQQFINTYIACEPPTEPIQELTFNYTFKIDSDIHKSIKLKAIDKGLTMNELVGRLLSKFY